MSTSTSDRPPPESVGTEGGVIQPVKVGEWIDTNANSPADLPRVLEYLTALTLPVRPWDVTETINPFLGNLEGQCWPWNRAGTRYLDKGYVREAADVWAGMYLAQLSLQHKFHYRHHKGMALCNIGFTLGHPAQKDWQGKCWLLGIVEDALTNIETCRNQASYKNLFITASRPVLDQLIATVESRFLNTGLVPFLPEVVLDFWRNPLFRTPSQQCIENMEKLLEALSASYPCLPPQRSPWELLQETWSFIEWSAPRFLKLA